MRSYGQYCSVAKSLDLVGDRWTLLVVRELLVQGPCRFTDLRRGLPGIASNLLSERLKEMEVNGLIKRMPPVAPIATDLIALTERGRELESVLTALGQWGVPLMVAPREGDEFRGHWFNFVVSNFLVDKNPDGAEIDIDLRAAEESVHIHVDRGEVSLCPGPASSPVLNLAGTPSLILGVLTGYLSIIEASALGLESFGDEAALARVVPAPNAVRNVQGELIS